MAAPLAAQVSNAALAELVTRTTGVYKQIPRSSRRNPLPVKLIDGSLLMRHEHLACALV